jgi:antitoxin component HigA of HigAB toxin-antitoxin module
VKTRRIKMTMNPVRYYFNLKKSTPRKVLTEIADRYSPYFADDPDDELVDITTTEWYKNMEKEMKPMDYLKHLREIHGLTQKALGDNVGTNAAHISDYETGQRAISKEMAKKLGEIFKTSPATFI